MAAEVWLFPYLSFDHSERVGPWHLIRRDRLRGRHVAERWLLPLVRGLGELYKPEGDPMVGDHLGCFVVGRGRKVGDPHDREQMLTLRRAVTIGLLDGNPTTADRGQAASVSTADNATLYGHNVSTEGFVSAEYGAMVHTLEGGNKIGEPGSQIRPPVELHLPLFGSAFDAPYAAAVYAILSRGDDLAIRLSRAIEWLDLSWRNTTSITPDLRVVTIRSGFEVLLGVGNGAGPVARALSTLLDSPNEPKVTQTWPSLKGRPLSEDFTDLGWWSMNFSFLRNVISHGERVPAGQYRYNGESHVILGERALRRAIKETVARQGYPALRRSRDDREWDRAVAAAVRAVNRPGAG